MNIEPSKQELFIFINDLIKKTKNKLIITTGSDTPKVLTDILPKIAKINVKIYENLSFFELQNITAKSNVLIACHGAISHIAAANKIKTRHVYNAFNTIELEFIYEGLLK